MVALLAEARAVGVLREEAAGVRSGRSSTPRGTARSRACSARPSGSRPTPTSCGRKPSPTSTPTATAAASSGGRLAHARALRQRGRARRHRSARRNVSVCEARAGARDRARGRRRRAARGARRGAICGSTRSGRGPTTRRSSSTSAVAVAQRSDSAARTAGGVYHSIYDSLRPLQAVRRSRLRLRRGARAGRRHRRTLRLARGATCCRSIRDRWRDTVGRYVQEVKKLAENRAGRDRGGEPRIRDGIVCRWSRTRRRPFVAPAEKPWRRHSTSRRSRTRRPQLTAAAARYEKALGSRATRAPLGSTSANERSNATRCSERTPLTDARACRAPLVRT